MNAPLTPLFLTLVLGNLPLQDSTSPGETLVSPPQDPPQRVQAPTPTGDLTGAVHDIADLTGAAQLAALEPTPELFEPERVQELLARLEAARELRQRVRSAADGLLAALRAYMEPPFVPAQHEVQLISDSMLLVHASPAQQAWVERFLEVQREDTAMIDVQIRILHVPLGLLARMGVESSASILESEAQSDDLLRTLLAHDGVREVTAPRLLTYPRQRANLSVTNQVAYISEYELRVVEPGAVEIADPMIDVIREGVVFELAAVPLGDGRIGVDVDLTHSSLERPIRTVTRVIGAGRHEVTIGKPEVTEVGVHTRLIMRAGATAVFVTPDPVQDLDMATLVRLRRVVPSELGLDRVPAAGERRTREK